MKATKKKAVAKVTKAPAPKAAATPETLQVAILYRIGESLYGTHWSADLAKEFKDYGFPCTKSMLSRIIHGSRKMPADMGVPLRAAVLNHIAILSECLALEGVPERTSAKTKAAIALIMEGVEVGFGEKPPKG